MNLAAATKIEATYNVYDDDGEVEFTDHDDVTEQVQRLVADYEKQVKQNKALADELTKLRAGGSWFNLETTEDKLTRQMVIVRTEFRMQAVTMRLEVSPELFYGTGMSPYHNPTAQPLANRPGDRT